MVALWAWFKGRWLRYVTRRGVRGRGSPGPVRALALHARDSQGLLTSPHFQAGVQLLGFGGILYVFRAECAEDRRRRRVRPPKPKP